MKSNVIALRLFAVAVMLSACVALSSAQENRQPRSSTQTLKGAVTGVENIVPQNIEIVATDHKFTPSEFVVEPGRRLKITLVNEGKSPHNIEFDLPNKNKLKISQDVAAGGTGTLEFTAPAPGTFTFICPVDFHSTLGMKGRMIVRP